MANKYSLEGMHRLAKSKEGRCLSEEYINTKTKLIWECKKKHQWKAIPESIIRLGTWCPECAGHKKLDLDKMQAVARSRGGKCLSALYVNVDTNYFWECSKGHEFRNTFSHIKNGGQWCPVCSKSGVSEEVCRVTFEQVFGERFIKVKPSWLRNTKGNLMELDGYSEKLKIAFEYQGAQHFRVLKVYTKSDEALTKRIDDDLLKQTICKANGVNLFILDETMPYDSFAKEIKKQSRSFGIDISNYNFTKIDINQAHIRNDRLEELRSLLDKKEIDLLSDKFLTAKEKYSMKCRIDGHVWRAIGSEIFAGAGCKKCAMKKLHNKQVGNIQTVIDFAESNNGIVLTKEYLGARGSYEFRCKNNHAFIGILSNLKFRKQWCPYCEKNPHRIAKLK